MLRLPRLAARPASAPRPAPPDPDAPRHGPNLTYIPAFDGLRAFAVLSVMAFHGGVGFVSGGFLGVDTFFVLSGFLITTLLIGEWRQRGTVRLGAFWARRARRLLPALLLVLLFVAAYAAFAVPAGAYPDLRLDSLSTLFYVANWHFILTGANYFAAHGPPSPLTHTWSLAIEEQFYLVWPLVVLGVLTFTKSVRLLLGVCVGGAALSALWMGSLYHQGVNLTRLYYGTDTHAQCLLVGAGLACGLSLVAERRRHRGTVVPIGGYGTQLPGGDPAWAMTGRARLVLGLAGLLGAVGTALMWWRVDGQQAFVYRGGFMIAALLTAAMLASVVCVQRGALAVGLSWAPLRYLGRISYGLYLWHYPLFLFLDHGRTHLSGAALFLFRVAVTVAVATVSFYLVERPIRQGTFFRDWRAWLATPAAVAVVVVALVGATVTPAVAVPRTPTPPANSALYSGPPVKMLLVGDSTALTLGLGLAVTTIDQKYDFTEMDEGILGCGVAEGEWTRLTGVVSPTVAPCQPSTPVDHQWPADWEGWIAQDHPSVVVFLAGRWEVADRTYNGRWTNILDPAFDVYLKGQLQEAVDVATAQGAHMVMLTAPCYDSGEQPDGAPWPEDDPARVVRYNQLVDEVAAANPQKVTVVDLYKMACPGGQFSPDLHGITVRSDDGIHFTLQGGEYFAPALMPPIIAAARSAMAPTTSTTAPSH